MEKIGTICGISGATLAACGLGAFGYPLFTLSSIFLLRSSFIQGNKNLMMLQGAFLLTNIIGIFHYVI
jgi:hypothetical protein